MTQFYDTHAHLDYSDFQADFEQILLRAEQAGITRLISIGTDFDSSLRVLKLAEQHPQIYAVVGWHPCEAMLAPEDIRPMLRDMASHPKVVALGETGLDHHHLPSTKPGGNSNDDPAFKLKQKAMFQQHLEVAAERGLNCVIHQRNAFAETIEVLKPFASSVRGVFHCFVDDSQAMRQVVELNSIVSFTGIMTFKSAEVIRQTLRDTPPDRFMLETDSPFLAPLPFRGKRCEPAYVREIAARAAEIRGVSQEDLSFQTCRTAHGFFSKMH